VTAEEPSRRFRIHLAGVLLDVDSDDDGLIDELRALLGAPQCPPFASLPALGARVRTSGPAMGELRLQVQDSRQLDPADLRLAASSADFPFDVLESAERRVVLARRGERTPALIVDGAQCAFALVPGWRKMVALLLLQRLMRARSDAIFFHAGSACVRGAGAMVVGPKGAGKSTLVMGLALRGHALLGDENACYLPGTGELIPFLRPVGIKPGPRPAALDSALARIGRSPEREGMMRLPVEQLGDVPLGRPAHLAAVVFLTGFSAAARMRPIAPGRVDVGRLQPVGSSLVNAPAARRVFEMARLLAGCRVYELSVGPPDETAAVLEEALCAA